MNKTRLGTNRRTVCPSCKEIIRFRPERDDLGVCPRCGEWLIGHGRQNRYLERLDSDTGKDYEGSTGFGVHSGKRLN
ncbi:hypothetical protein IH601_07225 [Candidatus Bipolaricaulota bacterium]|nr:hypothetical protein [Candidatus Bipolaricaulota bacterium]